MTYLRRNNKNQITSLFYPFTPLYNISQIVTIMVSSEKVRQRCLWISINPGSTNKPRGEQACEIKSVCGNNLYFSPVLSAYGLRNDLKIMFCAVLVPVLCLCPCRAMPCWCCAVLFYSDSADRFICIEKERVKYKQ